MRFYLIFPFLLFFSKIIFAQNCITVDSVYQNVTEKLILEKVFTIDSTSKPELIKNTKNWGGQTFANLKEVLVSETEDQLVFNYIESNYYYIRLIVKFKDGKVKVSFYDDGNVSGVFAPRSRFWTDWFEQKPVTCEKSLYKREYLLITKYRENVVATSKRLENYLQNVKIKNEDDF